MNIQINPQGYQTDQSAQITSSSEFIESQLLNSGKQLSVAVGDVLSGRVTDLKGNSILLTLDSGQTLSAKLNGDMNIGIGQSLSFEVRSNANNKVELSPLHTNLNTTPTVLSALSEASLPPTEKNVAMVQNMMEEGMAVNKQALLDMVDNLNANPSVSVETLIKMQKLGLSMDSTTIHQFENYENFEHKIVGDVLNMSDGLSNLFSEMISNADENSAFDSLSQILDMALTKNTQDADNSQINTSVLDEKQLGAAIDDLINGLKESIGESGISDNGTLLNKANMLLKTYLTDTQAFSEAIKERLTELFDSTEFKDVLKDNLVKQLTLKPEEIREEGKVEELYKKILENGNKALDIFNNSHVESQSAAKAAQNLMDNVQFMNQLNEMMTYVQLPLKLSHENAHGDLYVYTNKKNLAQKDGNFSALLHLDMEHLGPMDVYVAMQQEKVNTHFYMQDEETLDFIEANIHILDERLAKKGYKMNTTVSVTEKTKSMVETFLEDKSSDGTHAPVLSTFSFDARV